MSFKNGTKQARAAFARMGNDCELWKKNKSGRRVNAQGVECDSSRVAHKRAIKKQFKKQAQAKRKRKSLGLNDFMSGVKRFFKRKKK